MISATTREISKSVEFYQPGIALDQQSPAAQSIVHFAVFRFVYRAAVYVAVGDTNVGFTPISYSQFSMWRSTKLLALAILE
jgi:hypothetical protein